MLKKTYMSVPSYMDIGMIDIYLLANFDQLNAIIVASTDL